MAAQNSNITTASLVPDETGASKKEHPLETALSSPAASTPDVEVSCHGSIYIFTPLTPAAREWVAKFLPEDAQQWAGGTVVEHRFIADIVQGAQRDGLSVMRS
jgi:hypothetical protein